MSQSKKFSVLFLLFLVAVVLNITLGSVILPKKILLDLLDFNLNQDSPYHQIIFDFRMPKMFAAILSGIGLGLSGLFMQSIFRNPIVGPYVLGLSSGAGLGVALLILGGSLIGINLYSGVSVVLAAALGSTLTLLLLISFYYKLKNTVGLLIVGLMIGIFSGAVINILSYFTQAQKLQKYVFWSMGNLGNLSWNNILLLTIIIIISVGIILFKIKPVNALLLGENYARTMGVNIRKTNLTVIIITGILTGSITAFVGPIAFIGLAVPHLARLIFKTQLLQYLVPAGMLIGSVLMLFCDMLAQLPGSILTLPINSLTALLGAPLLIYMIIKNKT